MLHDSQIIINWWMYFSIKEITRPISIATVSPFFFVDDYSYKIQIHNFRSILMILVKAVSYRRYLSLTTMGFMKVYMVSLLTVFFLQCTKNLANPNWIHDFGYQMKLQKNQWLSYHNFYGRSTSHVQDLTESQDLMDRGAALDLYSRESLMGYRIVFTKSMEFR